MSEVRTVIILGIDEGRRAGVIRIVRNSGNTDWMTKPEFQAWQKQHDKAGRLAEQVLETFGGRFNGPVSENPDEGGRDPSTATIEI